MNSGNINEILLASKRLSRIKIQLFDTFCDFNVIWCRVAYDFNENWTKKAHRHNFYEVQFALTGKSDFFIENNQKISISEGDFIVINPKIIHQITEVSSDFSKLVMGFTINFHSEHCDGIYFNTAFEKISSKTVYKASDNMFVLTDELLQYCYNNKPALLTAITSILQLFLVEIANQVLPNKTDYIYDNKKFEQDNRFENIEKFIYDNVVVDITNEDVARQINMSIKQMNRIAKKETGMTVSKLIIQAKIKKIKQLLENTDLSLEEIAEKTGLSNEYNLNRFFKQAEGLPPGKYRNSFRQ